MTACNGVVVSEHVTADEKFTPRVRNMLVRMRDFLVAAASVAQLNEPEAVAARVLSLLRSSSCDSVTMEVDGEKRTYSTRFIRHALAISLRCDVKVLKRDDDGLVDKLGIDCSVLDKVGLPDQQG